MFGGSGRRFSICRLLHKPSLRIVQINALVVPFFDSGGNNLADLSCERSLSPCWHDAQSLHNKAKRGVGLQEMCKSLFKRSLCFILTLPLIGAANGFLLNT